MIAQNNVTHMLVGKDLNILGSSSKRSDLATGQIGVFKVGSQTATTSALAAGDKFTIVTKNSKGVLVETPVIEYSGITKKAAIDYSAPAERARAIGYNGTSGSIDVIDNANYVAHIFWQDNSKTFGYGIPVKFAAYAASANATQAEIAAGLTANFNKNFQREVPKLIKAEVLLSDAGVATSGGVLSVSNGSKVVKIVESTGSAVDAGKYNADGSSIAAGDYLRIGTAVTDPCYLVASVTGVGTATAYITLDTKYQGTTNASVAAAGAEVISAANAANANAGVKLTALPLTEGFEPGLVRYDFLEFTIQLGSEVGATSQSSISTPTLGSGTYWATAQTEWFLKGNRGEAWRVGNYPKNVTLEATSGKTYNQISVSYATTNVQTIDRTVASFGTVMVATESPSSGSIYASLKTVLGL